MLKEGQLTDLEIRGLHPLSVGGLPLDEIVLNRTRIAYRLTIEDIEVKRFDARNLEVKGPAELRRLAIKGEADFRDAAFHHLELVEISWMDQMLAKGKKEVYLDGMTYENLTTKTDATISEKWPELLALLNLSRFNAKNYQKLGAFFQRCGLNNRADEVYISEKRREKRKRLQELRKIQWWHPNRWIIWLTQWLTRFFWGLLAGYGRKPFRVFLISLGLMLLGACIFEPAQMLSPVMMQSIGFSPNDWLHSIALRGILGLYCFLSAIPGWSGHLEIHTPDFFTFVFLWLQRLCGWILIPIGLAAFIPG